MYLCCLVTGDPTVCAAAHIQVIKCHMSLVRTTRWYYNSPIACYITVYILSKALVGQRHKGALYVNLSLSLYVRAFVSPRISLGADCFDSTLIQLISLYSGL